MIYFIIAIILVFVTKFIYDKYILDQGIRKEGGIRNKYKELVNFLSNGPKQFINVVDKGRHLDIVITTATIKTLYTLTPGFDALSVQVSMNYGKLGTIENSWNFNTNKYSQRDMINAITIYLRSAQRRFHNSITDIPAEDDDSHDWEEQELNIDIEQKNVEINEYPNSPLLKQDDSIGRDDNVNLGDALKNKLENILKNKYSVQFKNILNESQIGILADKIALISRSFSDTEISIRNVDAALRTSTDLSTIREGLISISDNYRRNTIDNLGVVGSILGEQIIDVPHFTSNNSSIPLDHIYNQGYQLIELGSEVGLENEVLSILGKQ